MKAILATYLLFIDEQYLKQDWEDFNKLGRAIIKPFWYIKCVYFSVFAIIGFPLIWVHYQSLNNPKWIELQHEMDKFTEEVFNLNKNR